MVNKLKLMEVRRLLAEYRVAVSKVVKTYNKYLNFPQDAKDALVNEQSKLDDAIDILDGEL